MRQTLVFSKFQSPELNHLYSHYFTSVAGKVKITTPYTGTIQETIVPVPQVFHRFDVESPTQEATDRFKYFKTKILPNLQISALLTTSTLIFIPSYFDFVRLRNYLKEEQASFCKLSEYSSNQDISRSRFEFFHGNVSFMLYTERFHFFKRYNIRGIKNIVFYGLPMHNHFYSELINMIEDSQESSVMVMYCKYDKMRLERITGSKNAQLMIQGEKDSFMFT